MAEDRHEDVAGQAPGARPAGVKVLLVEDHDATREEVARLLAGQDDLQVVAAVGKGETAVEEARRHKPALMVVDILLPGMNGIDVCRVVSREVPGTRFVALSSRSGPGLVRAFLGAGGGGYVRKDSAFEELIPAVRAVLGGHQYLGSGAMEYA